MPDDFCITHGYEHMKSQFGNPIPYCNACEEERERPMNTMEQIARDMREGTFPAKSEATIREERGERPTGSNADEWHLFLSHYLDNRATQPDGLTYIAVQIAEAIDAAGSRS